MMEGVQEMPSFDIPQEVSQRINQNWPLSLIAKVVGRQVPFITFKDRILKIIHTKEPIHMIDLSNNYIILKCTNEADLNFVLVEGPWTIFLPLHCPAKMETML